MHGANLRADLLFNIRTGVRYHLRRQQFFDRWHRLTGVLSLVLSSAAVWAMLKEFRMAEYSAATVALLQAIDLVFETRKHADLHNSLRQRYVVLEPEVAGVDEVSYEEYKKLKSDIARIEIDEPPLKSILLAISQNEAAEVSSFSEEDYPSSYTRVGWFKALFANIL
jgi:hypothetical protein|tara:strand:- start:266 stop:766 length:501 start_codon:yes stop_codon:yes gene_type:complete